jgi:creatinine amidohydrolase
MDASELYDPEFRELIKSKKPTVIIPVGSIEQHGAHLPITTDSDIVTEVASRLAKKCGFIVFPTVSYGVSYEHDPLFNTSLPPEHFVELLQNIIFGLMENSLTSVIILNGHHGNELNLEKLNSIFNDPALAAAAAAEEARVADEEVRDHVLQAAQREASRAWLDTASAAEKISRIRLQICHYWKYMKHEFDHAGFVETSIMLAISDKVKMKKAKKGFTTNGLSEEEIQRIKKLSTQERGFPKVAKNGVWGDPTGATKKDGEKFLAEIVRNLAKECQS